MDSVIKSVSVNDSYFYAEMIIVKHFDAMDPFGGEKIKCIIKMNLYNSTNFVKENISNARPTVQTARQVRSEVILESTDLIKSHEDAMLLIYEEVGKQIAQDLFQANAREINMAVIDRHEDRKYI